MVNNSKLSKIIPMFDNGKAGFIVETSCPLDIHVEYTGDNTEVLVSVHFADGSRGPIKFNGEDKVKLPTCLMMLFVGQILEILEMSKYTDEDYGVLYAMSKKMRVQLMTSR